MPSKTSLHVAGLFLTRRKPWEREKHPLSFRLLSARVCVCVCVGAQWCLELSPPPGFVGQATWSGGRSYGPRSWSWLVVRAPRWAGDKGRGVNGRVGRPGGVGAGRAAAGVGGGGGGGGQWEVWATTRAGRGRAPAASPPLPPRGLSALRPRGSVARGPRGERPCWPRRWDWRGGSGEMGGDLPRGDSGGSGGRPGQRRFTRSPPSLTVPSNLEVTSKCGARAPPSTAWLAGSLRTCVCPVLPVPRLRPRVRPSPPLSPMCTLSPSVTCALMNTLCLQDSEGAGGHHSGPSTQLQVSCPLCSPHLSRDSLRCGRPSLPVRFPGFDGLSWNLSARVVMSWWTFDKRTGEKICLECALCCSWRKLGVNL
jgi:hypothetical protein